MDHKARQDTPETGLQNIDQRHKEISQNNCANLFTIGMLTEAGTRSYYCNAIFLTTSFPSAT